MVSKREVDAFNNAVRNYTNWVESIKALSSSLKDGWFTSALVNPAMLELVGSSRGLKQGYSFNGYLCSPLNLIFIPCSRKSTSDVGWGFSILVDSGRGQPLSNFAPRPDFILLPRGFCPIMLGEIVSDLQNESDRSRMLLQLAVCARMNALLVKTNDPPLVVQAIYLSKEYEAERYLAYAETKVGCVGRVQAPPHLCFCRMTQQRPQRFASLATNSTSQPVTALSVSSALCTTSNPS